MRNVQVQNVFVLQLDVADDETQSVYGRKCVAQVTLVRELLGRPDEPNGDLGEESCFMGRGHSGYYRICVHEVVSSIVLSMYIPTPRREPQESLVAGPGVWEGC